MKKFKIFYFVSIIFLFIEGILANSTELGVLYNSDTDIYGFQFSVTGGVNIASASGGDAEDAGFTTSTGNNTVLSFSFTGAYIPAGSGVLTTLEVDGDVSATCLEELVFSGIGGVGLDAEISDLDCLTIMITGPPVLGCMDEMSCNYNFEATEDDGSCNISDCAGECNGEETGENYLDNCGTCDADSSNDCTQDCAGVWGGAAVEDDCGICNGDGTSCLFVTISFGEFTDSTVAILMDNPISVAGFQFYINGLNITSVDGGSAEAAGFQVSTGNSTVLGFSSTGAVIPSGNSVLTNLSFDLISGDAICILDVILSDSNGVGIPYETSGCVNPGNYFDGGCSDTSACNHEEPPSK